MCTGNGYYYARLMRYLLRIRYTRRNCSGTSSIRLIARPSVDKIGDFGDGVERWRTRREILKRFGRELYFWASSICDKGTLSREINWP